ncbi:Fur family transcriptional regulator, ferric uptake regulator [Paraburkholderia megapolitana]|uniref:Ferric uptake regulation protein n=2 Tax=Burkholderiaceae TaxID=119060 RepID=A0A1I3D4A4_9BURK|nr:Fur family transcriptional regulator, ferric uptake regulator [Paraburkholderia megapolitana]
MPRFLTATRRKEATAAPVECPHGHASAKNRRSQHDVTLMTIHEDLQNVGLRATRPRVLVLDLFRTHGHVHLSAEQIYRRVTEEVRHMSLPTVYRVLGQLVDVGLLASVTFGDGRMVYELSDGKRHDHLICTGCGCVQEFFDPVIDARQAAIASDLDFQLADRQLVLFGLCATCRSHAS